MSADAAGRDPGREPREEVRRGHGARRHLAALGEGECLGLIGDNGAGKSTLVKILSGFHRPDSGRIFVNGEEATLRSVDHARSLGIDTVYQDLALDPDAVRRAQHVPEPRADARDRPVPLAVER